MLESERASHSREGVFLIVWLMLDIEYNTVQRSVLLYSVSRLVIRIRIRPFAIVRSLAWT